MTGTPDGWRTIACPLCGGSDHQAVCSSADWALKSSDRFTVVRCSSCRLAFLNPRPSEERIGEYYSASYSPYRARKTRQKTKGPTWLMLRRLWGAPDVQPGSIARVMADAMIALRGQSSVPAGMKWHGQGRLLDFGCGSGEFLRRMSHLGWQATGIDFSETAVSSVRDMGIEAFQGTLPNAQLTGRQFDVIVMRMSLEHVEQPLETVKAAAQLLAPGGLIHIVVPNFDSWYRFRYGEHWFPLDLPRHLTHFEPQTLRRLLDTAGLNVLEVKTRYDDGVFRKTMDLCKRRNQPTGFDGIVASIKPLRKLLGHYRSGSVAGDDLYATAERQA